MIQINLLPDLKKEHLKAVRQKKVIISSAVITSGVFLGIVVLLAVTVFAVQKKHISDLTNDINKHITTLQEVEDLDKVLTIQNQLSALPGLYDQKPNANNLFQYLSVITPSDVRLTSTQISFDPSSGSMEISGNTAEFKDANRFVDIVKNAQFKALSTGSGEEASGTAFTEVVLGSISKNDNEQDASRRTSFTIILKYDPKIFDIKYDKVSLTVPSIVSSVSSTEKPNFNTQPFDEEGQQE